MPTLAVRPSYLPQISMALDEVLDKLKEEGIEHKKLLVNPNVLKPLQGIVFGEELSKMNLDETDPIFISKDLEILDGHHRYAKALSDNEPIKIILLSLNSKEACRILNKIQDIYDYENNINLEEVEAQDSINVLNDGDGYLAQWQGDDYTSNQPNPKTILGYRKEPIRENSKSGNYFLQQPFNDASKYQIEFENLLETEKLGLQDKTKENPLESLSKVWFPHINFENLAKQKGLDKNKLIARFVADKAKQHNFDGIKFGESFVLGFK